MVKFRRSLLLLIVSLPLIQPAMAQRKVSLRMKGEVTAVNAPIISMTNTSKKKWDIQLKPKNPLNDIIFNGVADASILRKGVLVRFSTRLDTKGKAQDPVTDMFAFVMREGYQTGVLAEGDGNYLVAGQLTSINDGKIRVKAGRRSISAQLSPDVRVNLDIAELTFIKPGDKIQVLKGHFYDKGKGFAERIIVTAKEPITADDVGSE